VSIDLLSKSLSGRGSGVALPLLLLFSDLFLLRIIKQFKECIKKVQIHYLSMYMDFQSYWAKTTQFPKEKKQIKVGE